MRPKPFNLNDFKFKYNPYYQAIVVSLNIKNYPIVCYQAGISMKLFQFIEILNIIFHQLMISFLQRCGCFRVLLTIIKQCFSGNDVEHKTKASKMFTNGKPFSYCVYGLYGSLKLKSNGNSRDDECFNFSWYVANF